LARRRRGPAAAVRGGRGGGRGAALHPGPTAVGEVLARRAGGGRRPGAGDRGDHGRRGAGALGGDAGGPGRAVPAGRAAAPGRGDGPPARPDRLPVPAGRGCVMKKTETTSTVLLKHHLKALKVPTV